MVYTLATIGDTVIPRMKTNCGDSPIGVDKPSNAQVTEWLTAAGIAVTNSDIEHYRQYMLNFENHQWCEKAEDDLTQRVLGKVHSNMREETNTVELADSAHRIYF